MGDVCLADFLPDERWRGHAIDRMGIDENASLCRIAIYDEFPCDMDRATLEAAGSKLIQGDISIDEVSAPFLSNPNIVADGKCAWLGAAEASRQIHRVNSKRIVC